MESRLYDTSTFDIGTLSYVLRYDNNDGGEGVLHFQVVDIRTQNALFEVNRRAIHLPVVVEEQFSFRVTAKLAAPA